MTIDLYRRITEASPGWTRAVKANDNDNLVLRTVFLPTDLDHWIGSMAFTEGVSKGDIIRTLLERGRKTYGKKTLAEQLAARSTARKAAGQRKARATRARKTMAGATQKAATSRA